MEKINIIKKRNVIFIITIGIAAANLSSLIFPALIVSLSANTEILIKNPLTPGIWAIPILIVSISILFFGIMYKTNRLPKIIYKAIKFLSDFEISKRTTFFIILITLIIYIALTIPELGVYEGDIWVDFEVIDKIVESYPEMEEVRISVKVLHVKNFLLFTSNEIFENVRVVPFIASIALLLVTYFFTFQVSKKRFAGVIAMLVLIQSENFLRYDSSATYANFWTLFYLLSLYLVYKKWYISPVGYFLGIFSKALTAMFLPMTLFYIYNSDISKKQKIRLTVIYSTIILIGFVIASVVLSESSFNVLGPSVETITDINYVDFWNSFALWPCGVVGSLRAAGRGPAAPGRPGGGHLEATRPLGKSAPHALLW